MWLGTWLSVRLWELSVSGGSTVLHFCTSWKNIANLKTNPLHMWNPKEPSMVPLAQDKKSERFTCTCNHVKDYTYWDVTDRLTATLLLIPQLSNYSNDMNCVHVCLCYLSMLSQRISFQHAKYTFCHMLV